MKRFLVFGGYRDDSAGGWDDFLNAFDTLEQAKGSVPNLDYRVVDWWEIVDVETLEIVVSSQDE